MRSTKQERAEMASKPKPKFRVGQVVVRGNSDYINRIRGREWGRCGHIFADSKSCCWYELVGTWTPEWDLRALTARV